MNRLHNAKLRMIDNTASKVSQKVSFAIMCYDVYFDTPKAVVKCFIYIVALEWAILPSALGTYSGLDECIMSNSYV